KEREGRKLERERESYSATALQLLLLLTQQSSLLQQLLQATHTHTHTLTLSHIHTHTLTNTHTHTQTGHRAKDFSAITENGRNSRNVPFQTELQLSNGNIILYIQIAQIPLYFGLQGYISFKIGRAHVCTP